MLVIGPSGTVARRATCALIVSVPYLFAPIPALSAGTPAGTSIVNIASATYTDDNDTVQTITSNDVTIRVEEVIDVALSSVGASPHAVVPGNPEYRLTFRITNTGNGPERFSLLASTALGGDQFDPSLSRIVLDTDGDGLYDPLVDRVYSPGNEPVLAPDATADVFVFVGLPSPVGNGDQGLVGLRALTLSGTGTPGTLFAGAGDGGSNAVLGNTAGSASTEATLLVAAGLPTLVKSQDLDTPAPARGSIVTYTISADLSDSGATNPAISDPIPEGTSYVPGSLALDGAPLSDAADGDAGSFTGTEIEVALQAGGSGPQVVTFQVEVN